MTNHAHPAPPASPAAQPAAPAVERERYREGTRVYESSGSFLVDTYTGMRSIEQCEQLAEEIAAAPRQVADLTRQLEEALAEIVRLKRHKAACHTDIGELEVRATTAEAHASEAERRVEELEAKLSSIESREYGKNMGLAQPQEQSHAT